MEDSFFVPLGDDRWRATVHTTGPWDVRAQHGGPPSALLSRAMQRVHPRDDMMIARFTCEILRPIPVGEHHRHRTAGAPRLSVELLEATMSCAGREVARAAAWRVQRTHGRPGGVPAPRAAAAARTSRTSPGHRPAGSTGTCRPSTSAPPAAA